MFKMKLWTLSSCIFPFSVNGSPHLPGWWDQKTYLLVKSHIHPCILPLFLPLFLPFHSLFSTEQPERPIQNERLAVPFFCFMREGSWYAGMICPHHLAHCLVPVSCPVHSAWVKEWNHWIPFPFQSTPGDLIHFSSLAFFVFIPQFVIPAKTSLLRTTWHLACLIPIFLLPTPSNFSHLRKSILCCV